MQIPPPVPRPPMPDQMRQAAVKLETAFIAEMLRSVGFGSHTHGLTAASGGDEFSTFLIAAQAERLAAAGGIGLAESLFNAMTRQSGGQDAQ